ncbi:MAG: glycosyltransferase family 2 protein [Blautia sp.]|uniref:glycosyltransferase family 2 protein n=1 Tax=Blautia sp. TaxID=1955243 RepID=UPI00258EA968|nr:glycosyltransferase family A protein [Blautia sp.]MCI7289268.1 glycosyltransferase family 2 protein [Blautia sp.]
MKWKYKITLFTPTYNRAYILENLYKSIQRQTYRNFEWLIVDDGSSDNTEGLVNKWLEDKNDFPIRYYKQTNGGKCRAINWGLDLAEGELFFIMDSDDYLTNNALERFVYWESTIANKPMFMVVVGNRGTTENYSPNRPLGASYRDGNVFERYPEYTKNVIDGEHAGVWYTEIHRKYKYPEFEGENFITPAVTWNRMAHDGYKVRVFDEIIWVCNYLQDGLTMQGNMRFIKNPKGAGLWLREKANFLHYSLIEKMKMWYTFYCDHTFCENPYRLTKKQCAEYIGAPLCMIYAAAMIHGISKKIKGKK